LDVITYSTLYPNAAQPRHGLFVEARLLQWRQRYEVNARVVAPVPWFPFPGDRFGAWGRFARVPAAESRNGIELVHPRYPLLPKVGMHLAPRGMAWATADAVGRAVAAFDGQRPVLDAHYFYPDGVAAAALARRFDLPLVISARGSDINQLPDFPAVRRRILHAARQANAIVAVSSALRERMVQIGIDADKIHVIRNGVDLDRFSPRDRDEQRRRLGLTGQVLLSVGNLLPVKGHDLVIEALAVLPDATLIIAGEGPERAALQSLSQRVGVTARVHFVGSINQNELVAYYNAADALILASSREGMANVLLESLACATPVVATRVGGNPEVVATAEAGRLTADRSAAAIGAAVNDLLANAPAREATRAYAETFAWTDVADLLQGLFESVAGARPARQGHVAS
jgi:glycosyltransferase involved in cell wall biosynthesis